MNITLLSKKITTEVGKNNKNYQKMEVAYKNNTFGGKVEGKNITSYSDAFKQLADVAEGTNLDVTVEKKNGFNEWTQVVPATGAAAPAQPAPSVQRGSASVPPTRSTYETPEERAIRQKLIVRQSSISNAIAIHSVGAKAVKVQDVLDTAQEISNWVFENQALTGFEDMRDDDPSVGVEVA